ncbi:MAG: hypothetical protein COT81_05580 [Candidatus Buchananbacteria bacterium CG10_big_fil_rev_8_21_14_0_10_42_9]|uniref:Transcriptional regulator n=1 Tax=Candidatus Buchananbacteria bacterium CG10_big_fil_rev_8_21_14_0_10_42_9 TaxID=1974526 RepID=A0A2H0VZU7_9BACT|nr:MAG: hypothetical protein COT81_05580 [Candidatus Buchananbacteria bacterium CG10_big_fil_rev_8_21_14_0_10_42_9]
MVKLKSKQSNDQLLKAMLGLIKKRPGIRPREMHTILGLEHSAHLRNTLIKRGLVKKQRKGAAVHYYPFKTGKK